MIFSLLFYSYVFISSFSFTIGLVQYANEVERQKNLIKRTRHNALIDNPYTIKGRNETIIEIK